MNGKLTAVEEHLIRLVRWAGICFACDDLLYFDEPLEVERYEFGPSFSFADFIDTDTGTAYRFCHLDSADLDCESDDDEPETGFCVDLRKASDLVPVCFALFEEAEAELADQAQRVVLAWREFDDDFWYIRRDETRKIGLFHSRFSDSAESD